MKDCRPFGVALRGRLQTTTCCGNGDVTVVSDVEKVSGEQGVGGYEQGYARDRRVATDITAEALSR